MESEEQSVRVIVPMMSSSKTTILHNKQKSIDNYPGNDLPSSRRRLYT